MTQEFDPTNMSEDAVRAQCKQMSLANEERVRNSIETRSLHGALALTGAFVLLRTTGIEAFEDTANWCGGLAALSVSIAVSVSPDHRPLPAKVRNVVTEFINPPVQDLTQVPRVTVAQLVQQESDELESRGSSWFWSKWNNLEY